MIINKKRLKKILTNDYEQKEMHVNRVYRGTRQQYSEMRLSRQFQACFFLQKDFARTKTTKT